MTQKPKQIRLNLNIRALGFHRAGWKHSSAAPERVQDIGFFIELAKAAEAATLDGIFLPDTPALSPAGNYSWPLDHSLEPFTILSSIAAQTSHIGIIGTISTTYSDLLTAAARTATLDHLSGGRSAVNFVTSAGEAAARNYGFETHPDYPRRYERATSFIDAIVALWDPAAAQEARPRRRVSYKNAFFEVDTQLSAPPSRQGRPLIVQAGASENGRDLAASRAEAIYCASSTLQNGQALYADLKERAKGFGRGPDKFVILPGVVPYVGGTENEAQRFFDELEELANDTVDPIAILSQRLQTDLSLFDPDGPFPFEALPPIEMLNRGVTGQLRLIAWAREERWSIRRLAVEARRKLSGIQWNLIGTPEQIADGLERWFREKAADGFNILPPVYPFGAIAFFDGVIPELRSRGLFRNHYDGETLSETLALS